jgi:hypothetical protein
LTSIRCRPVRRGIIHLPIDGPTPLPEYSSYRVWLSDLARRLEAGAFTVDDGGSIQLNP